MNKMSLIVCVAVLVALATARPNPGLGDQIKDMGLDTGSFPDFGLDTGSVPDFGSILCKGSDFAGGKGKAGFPGIDKFPGMNKFVGSNCTTVPSNNTGSDKTTEATTIGIVVATESA